MKFKEIIYADRWVNGSGFKTQGSILNSKICEFKSLEDVLKISRHDYDDYLADLNADVENGDIRIIVDFYDISDDNDDDNDNIVHHLEWWMGDEDDEDDEDAE